MKMKGLLMFAVALMFAACTNTHNSTEHIELNEGQKWIVNAEMKPYIEQGRELLNAYLSQADTDNKNLATKLQEQNSKLIRSCTMDGKSHDELHKWLLPHLQLVKQLSDAETPDEVTKVTDKLKASYDLYDKHFE
ncbi:hypothetical protein ACFLR1_01285 [Bacteroidota bacterium]